MFFCISQIRRRHGETSSATGYRRRGELEELGAAGPLHLRWPQTSSADYLDTVQETTPVLRRSASPTERWQPASTKYRRRPASTSRRWLPSKHHEGPDAKHLRASRLRGHSKHLLNTSTRLRGHRGRHQCTQPL